MESFPQELYVTGKVKLLGNGLPVGSGGFGDVFKGRHSVCGQVALKQVDFNRIPRKERVLKLISAEVKAWKSLSHRHILPFLGLYAKKGHLYMVSPWVEHGCLMDYLKKHPDADRVQFIRETADALSYLHEQKTIHGDIKGCNILVSTTIHALLCDFGLSRSIDEKTQTQLKGSGSHRWMAPEIWEEKPKSFASDVFSFGMTIYEVSKIISGNMPLFQYQDSIPAVVAVTRGKRPPTQPETAPNGTSYTPLWVIAMDCWKEQPEARPSAAKVFQDLLRVSPITTPAPQASQTYELYIDANDDRAPGPSYASGEGHSELNERFIRTERGDIVVRVKFMLRQCNTADSDRPKKGRAKRDTSFIVGKVAFDPQHPLYASGFCLLYKGRHPIYGQVAMKLINTELGGTEMMMNEVKTWQSLLHHHILELYGLYSNSGVTYLISPWATNGHLTAYVREHKDADRAKFIRETADALNYLHANNVIHGDVKGSNILVTSEARVKLCDFGLSRLTSIPTGAPLKGADTFAFGITICEILSGKTPFDHLTVDAAASMAILAGERPFKIPATSYRNESWAPLWAVAEKCWAAEAKDRPSMQVIFWDLSEISPPGETSLSGSTTPEMSPRSRSASPVSVGTDTKLVRTVRSVAHTIFPSWFSTTQSLKRSDSRSSIVQPYSNTTPAGFPRPVDTSSSPSGSSSQTAVLRGLEVKVDGKNTVAAGRHALSSGALGDLYCGSDIDSGRATVALRRCRLPSARLSNVYREQLSDFWNDLDQRFILPFSGFGQDSNGLLYLAFPWITGGSLWDYAQETPKEDRSREDRLVRYLSEAAESLAYLHERELTHRNIKAQNILLRNDRAVLCDIIPSDLALLLVAKRIRETHPSPELRLSNFPTPQSDVFAFGFTIYEVLEGTNPPVEYTNDTSGLIKTILRADRSMESTLTSVWGVAESCWRTEAEERPPMSSVCEKLATLVINTPVRSCDDLGLD
ncbi:hypothetical protein FRB99_003337 [Tulasnella sp. 403]|nr:hypothetical protein FRB99_003337 [Tulasnella sp. 403]